ncbi:MAG: hypothetical protein RB191_03510 [Terriglobia bacterium]|nr:hypothetical protein [Terriglobia bacterium]
MRKIAFYLCLLFVVLSVGHKAFAQETSKAPEDSKAQNTSKAQEPPVHYYHLSFLIQETGADGKPVNSRTYTTNVSTDPHDNFGTIRTGARIPIIATTTAGPQSGSEYQYVDVGVNFDTRSTQEIGRLLSINLTAAVSSIASSTDPSLHEPPVIRQNKWQARVLIPIGKPTVVFTSDSLDSKGGMQVVVTATQIE